jgi:16S rRNA (cytosine967-C5)-methyltransferase
LLPELIEGALQHLSPEDRAQRLKTETLWDWRADRMLARFLAKTPPLSVRNVCGFARLNWRR